MSPACLLLHVSCKASWWRPVFGEGGTRCATTFLQFDPVVHYFDVLQGGYIVHGFFVFIQLFIVQFCDFHFHFFCIFGVCTGSIFFTGHRTPLTRTPAGHAAPGLAVQQEVGWRGTLWTPILILQAATFGRLSLKCMPIVGVTDSSSRDTTKRPPQGVCAEWRSMG